MEMYGNSTLELREPIKTRYSIRWHHSIHSSAIF